MNELLNELLTLIDQHEIRIQPYTLEDSQREAIEARIDDWLRRARMTIPKPAVADDMDTIPHCPELNGGGPLPCICLMCVLARQVQAIDPQHCYLCDRPKLDCACTLEESESPV